MVHIGHPEECVICLEKLSGNVVQLDCKHVFHYDCISQMFPNKRVLRQTRYSLVRRSNGEEEVEVNCPLSNCCPNCRKPIDPKQMKQWLDYVNRKKRSRPEGVLEEEYEKRKKKNRKRMERRLKKEEKERKEKERNKELCENDITVIE
ncbi:diaphanous-related formin [Gracilaria domingensis]|nr:diaphanous-related formin [Gracilaria domingensis]